jgi:hypothetical protein
MERGLRRLTPHAKPRPRKKMITRRKQYRFSLGLTSIAMGLLLLFIAPQSAHATGTYGLNQIVIYYVSTTGADGYDCLSYTYACLTIQEAVTQASLAKDQSVTGSASTSTSSTNGSWAGGSAQVDLYNNNATGRDTFSGLFITNTFTGALGQNSATDGFPNRSNFLAIWGIVGSDGKYPGISAAQYSGGQIGHGADIDCDAGAQILLNNVALMVPPGGWGVASFHGCQMLLEGEIDFIGPTTTQTPAADAFIQQHTSTIIVNPTKLNFNGYYDTVINSEGTGEIEFL